MYVTLPKPLLLSSGDANQGNPDETVGLILWSSTELLVTIMTACIPCYRELWIRTFREHGSNAYYNNSNSVRLQSTNQKPAQESNSDYDSSANKVETQIYFGESDDQSDRGILRNGELGHGGVKVTSDVMVNVE